MHFAASVCCDAVCVTCCKRGDCCWPRSLLFSVLFVWATGALVLIDTQWLCHVGWCKPSSLYLEQRQQKKKQEINHPRLNPTMISCTCFLSAWAFAASLGSHWDMSKLFHRSRRSSPVGAPPIASPTREKPDAFFWQGSRDRSLYFLLHYQHL